MNNKDIKYRKYGLITDMLEAAAAVAGMDPAAICRHSCRHKRILLTGEGSSRIFPAKNVLYTAGCLGYPASIHSEGARQSAEYDLSGCSVYVASNSGKTAEALALVHKLNSRHDCQLTGIAAFADSPLISECSESYVLKCGSERAVAATKSVIEQAMFYDILFRNSFRQELPDLVRLSELMEQVLTMDIPSDITEQLTGASLLYIAGRNNGTAEELALKTNEILRKKSQFLEGTYAVHGVEEVVKEDEALIIIDPFPEEELTFKKIFSDTLGIPVMAIAARQTAFPTLVLPSYTGFDSYLQLCCGWNLLVEAGISLGVDLDHPLRARKIGNEYNTGTPGKAE
ncbi:MAG: sugar isomerase [Spirochaetales bacterium]|nr:sugar isomerase [Spirochaetales bacterium]